MGSRKASADAGKRREATQTTRVITAAMPADRSKVTLKMLPGSGASGELTLTARGLELLIRTLGQVHAAMREGQQIPPFEPGTIQAVFNPRWQVSSGLMGEASAFAFHHPAYGPLGFLVPIEQVATLVEALSQHVEAASLAKQTVKN